MSLEKDRNRDKEEIIECIGSYINDDIELLISNERIDMGTHIVPSFDEYEVFQDILKKVNEIEQKEQQKKHRFLLSKWVAACVIMLVLLNVGYYFLADANYTPTYREVVTVRGERILVLLPDGSRVWLNADSKLTYPEHFSKYKRDVQLEGEAYFEVSKDMIAPFHVLAEDLEVKVTGTSFNVSAYASSETIEVTLDEGAISVGGYKNGAAMQEMNPGQTALYDKGKHFCNIQENVHYKEASSWKNNHLTFRNAKLQDVLNTLSRQFDLEFEIHNTEATAFTYNFVGKGSDLSNVIEVMEAITPIKFKKITVDKYVIE